MKRSEINALMKETVAFIRSHQFHLPPFAFWSPEEWKKKGHEADEIRDCMLGWDITDFGLGDFHKFGLILFTIRNGRMNDKRYPKPYAEKLLIVEEQQITLMHFHWNKAEDIINRGGGNLMIQLYNSTPTDKFAKSDVTVSIDGTRRTVKAGGIVTLTPGESICLPSRLYHKFWGQKGKGKILVGEVSKVNDDNTDNRFYEKVGRFPRIDEDVKPLYLLFSEYPKAR
jgi:D-lyxose ketol-isomerase